VPCLVAVVLQVEQLVQQNEGLAMQAAGSRAQAEAATEEAATANQQHKEADKARRAVQRKAWTASMRAKVALEAETRRRVLAEAQLSVSQAEVARCHLAFQQIRVLGDLIDTPAAAPASNV